MELWIRTQNKEKLLKVDYINIEETPQGQGYKEYYIGTKGILFGIYKTKERALEVLDEIQKMLLPTYKFIANKDLDGNDIKVYGVEYINSYVYEMPKE